MNNGHHISAVIFDLDGTLLNTELVTQEILEEFLARYGKVVDLEKEKKRWLQAKPHIGVNRLIKHLHRHGVPLAIASNSRTKNVDFKLSSQKGWKEYFSVILGGDQVKSGKPFLEAANKLDVDPSCCLVLEDSVDMTKESEDTSKKEVSTTSTPQLQCSMLKPSNYSLWAIRMQIILEANGLWEMIEPLETTQADNKKDKTAIAFLYQALPEEQLLQITKHKTAKVIWNALKTRHIGEERIQQARLQTLKSD
nr:bifunctional riboflavin kinase/FMN phosphatase-like [Tanacetum cinerariifolium]